MKFCPKCKGNTYLIADTKLLKVIRCKTCKGSGLVPLKGVKPKIMLLLACFLVFMFFGCEYPNKINSKTKTHCFHTIVIEGCEYLEYDYGIIDSRVYGITHKGNCKNCTKPKSNHE